MAKLLKEAQPYCAALGITLLLPKHRLWLSLCGKTPEERLQHLADIAEDMAEQLPGTPPDASHNFNYSFIQWFIQVVNCEFSTEEMEQWLKRRLWRRYKAG